MEYRRLEQAATRDKIDIVAANTDGITIYADKRLEPLINHLLNTYQRLFNIYVSR